MSERGSNPPEEKPKAEEAAAGKPRLPYILLRSGRPEYYASIAW